jgi:hypothetical protein
VIGNMKEPLLRLNSRWEDNIKMALREIRWDDVDTICRVQDRSQRSALLKRG